MIDRHSIDPFDYPSPSELNEPREDPRDYHDEPPAPRPVWTGWTMTNPRMTWDDAYPYPVDMLRLQQHADGTAGEPS